MKHREISPLVKKRLIITVLIIIVAFSFILFSIDPDFIATVFSIFPQENIQLPEVTEGEEITHLGYKYSKNSEIFVSTKPEIHCQWKPDNLDDGWKVCEAVFEIENKGSNRPKLVAPDIIFDFKENENIKNVEVSYSDDYEIEVEEILNQTIEKVDSTITEIEEEPTTSVLTGRAIEKIIDEKEIGRNVTRIKSQINLELEVAVPDITEVDKREFKNFKTFTFSLNKKIQVTNQTNNTEPEMPASNSSSEEIQEIITNSTNITAINKTTVDVNNTDEIKDSNETKNDTNSNSNTTIPTENANQSVQEANETDQIEEEIEQETKTEQENNTQETEVAEETHLPVEESTDEIEEEIEQEPLTAPTTGLTIFTENDEAESVSINTNRPFAIKIKFEIPKYSSNQFNFDLIEDSFHAKIDPDVSACGTLDTEDATYTLTQNLASTGTCLTVTANNITVDCQGQFINYSSSGTNGYGIYSTANQTAVKNCVISPDNKTTSIAYNIYFSSSNSGLITNNTLFTFLDKNPTSLEYGVGLLGSSNNLISNNTFKNIGDAPTSLYISGSSNYNILKSNSIFTNGSSSASAISFYIESSPGNVITNNVVSSAGPSSSYGVYLDTNSNITVRNNKMNMTRGSTSYWAFLEGSTDSEFTNNTVNHSAAGGSGVYIYSDSNNISIINNTIYTLASDVYAIYAESVNHQSFEDNNLTTTGADAYAVYISTVTSSNITNNIINSHGSNTYGVELESNSDNNNIIANTINVPASGGYGISFDSECNYNNVTNNTITSSGTNGLGIITASGENNTVTNNTILTIGSSAKGISVTSSRNTFTKNKITTKNSSSVGFHVTSSIINLTENTLSIEGNSSIGVQFASSADLIIADKENIKTNNSASNGIQVSATSQNITISNTLINTSYSGTYDIEITSSSNGFNLNLTNVTSTNTTWAEAANGTINLKWHLEVKANYTEGSALSNVNVTAWNREGTLQFSKLTNSSGFIEIQSLREYTQNSSNSIIHYSNYTINASLSDGSETLSQSLNLTENKDITFTFSTAGESGTGTSSSGSGSGSSSGGGGGGGGSGSGSTGDEECEPSWSCTSWSACTNGQQTRTCTNQTSCVSNKPAEQIACDNNKKDTLFDINLEIPETRIPPGNRVLASIGLINLGVPGRVEATLHYKIKDELEETIYEETEIVPVETQTEFIKEIPTENLEEGAYSILIDLTYEGQLEPAQAQSEFVISNLALSPNLRKNLILILAIILTSGSIISILAVNRLRKKRKERLLVPLKWYPAPVFNHDI